jgi:hypothetical protein
VAERVRVWGISNQGAWLSLDDFGLSVKRDGAVIRHGKRMGRRYEGARKGRESSAGRQAGNLNRLGRSPLDRDGGLERIRRRCYGRRVG